MKTGKISAVLCLCVAIASLIVRADAQNQAPASSAGSPQLKQVAYIKASNAEAADHFSCGGALDGHTGNSVALSADGNTMAIGAHQESSNAKGINGNQNNNLAYASGAVYVFTRTATSWAQQAYIKASNARQGANFGAVVGLSADGNTMAVSSHFESSASKGVNGNQNDESIPQAGAAYVFSRTGTTWTQQAYLKASNTGRAPVPNTPDDWGDGDQFGFSLAVSGDGNTVAVGAISEDGPASSINNFQFQDDDSAASSGAVYIFNRTGTTWSQQAYVKSANSRGGQLFGYCVGLSLDGNTMAVCGYDEGGSGRTPNAIPDQLRGGSGAIYVFTRADAAWRQSAYLKGSRSEGGDSLGYSVVISQDGNTIAAGSADEDCYTPGVNPVGCDNDRASNTSDGAAYVWFRNGNNWTEQAFIKSSNPGLEDWFGVRMALSGDGNTLAISAPLENSMGQGINPKQDDELASDAGAVYFFTREGTTWTQKAFVKAAHNEAYDEFGSALALSRDGRTLVVGARGEDSAAKGVNGTQFDNSASEAGAAFVFSYN
jgi:trimeric autotransporter adhesin